MTSSVLFLQMTAGTIFFIGLFVLKNGIKSNPNKIFFIFSVINSIWLLGRSIMLVCGPSVLDLITRLTYLNVLFIPVVYYNFAAEYVKKVSRKTLFIGYGISTFYAVTLFVKDSFITSIHHYSWGPYPRVSPLHISFMAYFSFFISKSLWLLKNYLSASNRGEDLAIQNRTKYLLLAYAVLVFAAVDFLPNYGIDIYPFGFVFVFLFLLIVAYSIIRYRFFDIEVIVRRTVVFAGLFAVVFGVIAASTYLGNEFFKNVLGWNQWLAVVPSVFLIVVIYRPLENWLVNLTEKFLFQKKYEYKYIIRQYIDEVVTEYDLDKIVKGTTYILDNTIHPEHFSIYLLDKDKEKPVYISKSGQGDSFDTSSSLVSYFNASRTFVSIEKESVASGLSTELRPRKVVLALPMFLQRELLGFFLMGRKKSGENYSPEDLQTLTDLAQVEAIVIHTAQYIHELQIMHAQMLRDNQARNIAEMSDGISHQFHNRFFAILKNAIYSCQVGTRLKSPKITLAQKYPSLL